MASTGHGRIMKVLAMAVLVLCGWWREAAAQLNSNDVAALKAIRSWLYDAPGASPAFFSTWDFRYDPCSFEGVLCDVEGGGQERVAALNLGDASANSLGLRGRLHPALGSLTSLAQLTLAPGKVGGSIPDTLAGLTNLQNLGLSHNLLIGAIPPSLGNLGQLATIDLSFNRLTGGVPREVAALPNLLALSLEHNRLSGTLPTFKAPVLTHLDLNRNAFEGPLPYLPPSLSYLSLSKNHLSGPLTSLAPLQLLSFLDLSFNQLTGTIPPSMFAAPLTSLLLQRNLLSGPLSPPQLVVIPTLDLSFNQLSGPISPFFAFVQNLYLNNNQFTGAVPQEFIDQLLSSSIQTLFLQHNFLTDFPMSPSFSLPLTAALCIQYNCMQPPIRSPCPHNAGKEQSRPSSQCKST